VFYQETCKHSQSIFFPFYLIYILHLNCQSVVCSLYSVLLTSVIYDVFSDTCVTVDAVVEGAHQGIMFNMGQVCCAGSRTYVHESIYDEFVKRSVERAKKRTTGDPFKTENENGPQVVIVTLGWLTELHFCVTADVIGDLFHSG